MGMSIKDVAELLGVSKTAVRKYMDAEFREKYTTIAPNGAIYIETEGVKFLRTKCNSLRKQAETSENKGVETTANQFAPQLDTAFGLLQRTIDLLQQELEAKDQQIVEQQKLIEELSRRKSFKEWLFGRKDALAVKENDNGCEV